MTSSTGCSAPAGDFDNRAERPAERAAIAAASAAAVRIGNVPGLTVNHRAVHGGASAVLLDAAEDAGLLIVGNRGVGGFRRLVLGSTSAQCVTHAVSPTVVVRNEPSGGPDRILVAVDGSDNSYAAADWAVRFATPGTEVKLAMVWDSSRFRAPPSDDDSLSPVEAAESAFDDWVDTFADNLGPTAAGTQIVRDFSSASPRPRLQELSEESTLFVVGARGHGAVGSMMLGSVSTWLLHNVNVPMAVVPVR